MIQRFIDKSSEYFDFYFQGQKRFCMARVRPAGCIEPGRTQSPGLADVLVYMGPAAHTPLLLGRPAAAFECVNLGLFFRKLRGKNSDFGMRRG